MNIVRVPGTTDRAVLVGDAYGDDRHLAARQSLYQWLRPRHDLPGRVLYHLQPVEGLVLDAGCGNGRYLDRLRSARPDLTAVGLDLSAGIMAEVPDPRAVGDVAALPLATRSVGAVLAMHMLYHVADIGAAVRELVRVLDPRGLLIVSTNARDDKAELDQLWSAAARQSLGAEPPARISLSSRFPLEAAADVLEGQFRRVEVEEHRGLISVPAAGPVIDHLGSYRTWAAETGVAFDPTLDHARALVEAEIRDRGAFRMTSRGGLIVCREPIQP